MRQVRRSIFALACVVGGVSLGAQASAAYAQPTLLTCQGTQKATYSPAITYTARLTTVGITERYSNCLAPNTKIVSGNAAFTVTQPANCTLMLIQSRPVSTYTWNTGQTSRVSFSTTEVLRLINGTTVVTSVGSVTGGIGTGAKAIRVVATLPPLNPFLCLTTGVSQQSGPATLTFASP